MNAINHFCPTCIFQLFLFLKVENSKFQFTSSAQNNGEAVLLTFKYCTFLFLEMKIKTVYKERERHTQERE